MVVEYDNAAAIFQKIRAFCNARLIDIHNNKNGIVIRHFDRLGIGDDRFFFMIQPALKGVYPRFDRIIGRVQDNMGISAKRLGDPVNTDRCTEAVHVGIGVSHDKHLVLGGNDFLEGKCFDSCLHSCIFLHLLALTAEVGNTFRRFDDDLIAATAECQINGSSCKFIILSIGKSVRTDSHTECDRHIVTDVDRLDIFQQVKAVFLQPFQRLFANDDEKFIFFHLLHNTVIGCKIFIEFSLDQRRQKGTSDFLDALEGFLVIVYIQKSDTEGLVIVLAQRDLQRSLIKQIQNDHKSLISAFGFKDIAVLHHFSQWDLAHLCSKFALLIGKGKLCQLIVFFWQFFLCDTGK